ncbi:monovalent cation:proton antiporter-2 (CPA2) family protein [Kordiimonas aquimaris]|uniref:monovalent cation:proton antiporter-2 (CPA2) family protein n=1 Tax=Kordiimonas aquimaris TaxID=707591 RepID=UPI0021CED3F7|nr:monovalent cation:proton antiporter-2 (CPA2) family protein [Kordiimonas aquimaris]
MDDHSFLNSAFLYLAAAVIAVPVFKRLGLGSVLGYLAAGMVIGPWGVAFIRDVDAILRFSEFGVVLLMFLIGLELNPKKLWNMHRQLIGFGSLQVVVSIILISLLAIIGGAALSIAVLAGLALALSSTPIALQTLEERRLLKSEIGKVSFSILLFQDISIIPILAILPVIAFNNGPFVFDLLIAAKVIAVIAFFIFSSRFLIRPLFRIIASTGQREVFTSFALMLVVGSGLLVEFVGISMALGTFLAGVLLADSEYRHELELNIEPFKGLLMGLFFIAVGMSVDLSLFMADPLWIIGLVLVLIVAKSLILMVLGHFAGFVWHEKILFALLLSPAGEFAFVLISVMSATTLMPDALAKTLLVVASFSMLLAPLLMFVYDFILRRSANVDARETDVIANEGHVIIAGFGRFGQIVGRLMLSLQVPVTVVDNNPTHIETLSKFGFQIFYGDITRYDLLEAAGAKDARLVVLAMDDPAAVQEAAKVLKAYYPKLTVLARAKNRGNVVELKELGVAHVRRETFSSALEIGEMALRELGYPAHFANRVAGRFRRYDEYAVDEIAKYRGDEAAVIDYAKKARKQLEELMSHDAQSLKNDDTW